MSANSGSGGVRNLRAMFENKASDQSTSPPSRGRSPNPSELSNNSRPISKVRASFVAVERNGETAGAPILGLRRLNSELSSQGNPTENHTMDVGNFDNALVETQAPILADTTHEPENSQPTASDTVEGGLGSILKGSAFEEDTPAKDTSEARKLGEALSSGRPQGKIAKSPSTPKDEAKAAEMVQKMEAGKRNKSGPPPTTLLQTTKSAQPVKPPATRQPTAKPVPKSPVTSRPSPKTQTSPMAHIRGGPAKIRGVMESAKAAQRAREVPQQDAVKSDKRKSDAHKLDTQSKPKPTTESVKKERTPTSPKAARSLGPVKPRSPTVPTKLPPVATASTAASAARSDAHHSPTEPNYRKPVARKPSATAVRPPRASISSTTSTLAKKASRASLTNGHDRPQSRVSTSKADDGFLARMMRPTASSAQKVHEKVLINSPPRSKVPSSHKAKDVTKHKPPPKMHLHPSKDHESENKENGIAVDQRAWPEAAAISPLAVVNEDTPPNTENQASAPASTEATDKVNGEGIAA
ncbi:hypothetical protein A1O1_01578 [Capronia coronata CBS 617.96]|uniref:Uncharacterized protein n=1 Tax=Capronia coronata CBS 617.96 TaxID=1182541 RepID=W9YU84_9EURO|nr:uncharacterized protein A1O1_01578 [Capronia coronata CBS 617.96]EXJ96452.1 hypothetical protein A1O1_01578 [Capronia coronata CBS 617.96]